MKRIALAVLLIAGLTVGCRPPRVDPVTPRSIVVAKFEAVNRHAVDDVVAFYAPDAVVTASDFCAPRLGHGGVRRTYQSLFATYPDIRADVHEYFVQGDRVAVRMTVRGSAQGRHFAVPIANYLTVRDGLIQNDDGVFDTRGRACSQ